MLAGCPPVVRVFVCSSIAAVVSANCLSWQKFQHLPSSLLMPKKCLRAPLPHLMGAKAPQPNTAPTDLQQVPEKLHILSDKCVGLSLPPLPPDCPTGFKIFKVDDKTLHRWFTWISNKVPGKRGTNWNGLGDLDLASLGPVNLDLHRASLGHILGDVHVGQLSILHLQGDRGVLWVLQHGRVR